MKETNEKHFTTFMKLIDALEEDDDVQKVYHNQFDEALNRVVTVVNKLVHQRFDHYIICNFRSL